jgi:hypothetical protein
MKINNKALSIILLLCLASNKAFSLPLDSQTAPDNDTNSPTAILQGLNKVTGKTSNLQIKVGEKINFGKLTIKVKKCWRAPLDQRPENKILLEVEEDASNQELEGESLIKIMDETISQENGLKKTIFHGWMFSSSPSISGLEHPIYDITAIECKN